MAASDSSVPGTTTGLSPVKQALVEIRRLRAELEQARRGQREPIAVVGLALRLPGGVTSPERFWQALAAGEDLIGTIPASRWRAQEWQGSGPDDAGTMYDLHGGFLEDIESFDADFFGINARQAASMDPQHRILLELSWEALERAAIDPRSLAGSSTGVWLGLSNSDYARRLTQDVLRIDGYTGIGGAACIAAGQIAYSLGLHGPAEVIDTACSSSLVAVHRAVQSLRCGETDLALVGGANLMLSPEIHVSFSRSGMLSRSGRCHTFDADADGYVRSEGCGVVVLRRLADARRLGDRVLAVIRGSAVNQDGRSAGITAPNGPAQEAVMRAALRDADLSADTVGYVEAHGTGTPLGDPMEWRAIGSVYGESRGTGEALYVGSVKTNLGHTEAAAGLVGLMKAVLMMERVREIPPHLHFSNPNPRMEWERWSMKVPVGRTPWPGDPGVRRIAVSSFGFSGTNAHLILESPSMEEGTAVRAERPLTAFQRRRFWFGESPEKEWQQSLDRGWEAALAAARTHSQLGALGWKPESYPERWAVLERLTVAHAAATLKAWPAFPAGKSATLDEVMERCEVQPIYGRLLQRWLTALVRAGQLTQEDDRYTPAGGWSAMNLESCWADAEAFLAHEPGMLTYLRRCGSLLPGVLTGKVDPLETLFPDGSFALAEAMYEEGDEARYSNRIVAEAVRTFVEQRREKRAMRLLEVGGGTGGTTAAVLPTLGEMPVEYWFTDVSEIFLNRGRRKFAAFDFVRYALFDLDGGEAQAMRTGSFDVILAANVVHASRNLPASLERLRQMLAPGGALVLLETTTHQACFDMSIGLIEGWQHFEDSERGDHPLLDAAKWCELLARCGFEGAKAVPEPNSPAAAVGQHVVLARRGVGDGNAVSPGEATKASEAPVQRAEEGKVAEVSAVAAQLSELSAEDRQEWAAARVRQTICRVFGLQVSPEELGDRDRLSDLGMDSLIALELRGELAKALGLEGRIPSTVAFDTGTVGELTRLLTELLQPAITGESRDMAAPVEPVPVAVTAETLQAMSEEEVEQLLMERMRKR